MNNGERLDLIQITSTAEDDKQTRKNVQSCRHLDPSTPTLTHPNVYPNLDLEFLTSDQFIVAHWSPAVDYYVYRLLSWTLSYDLDWELDLDRVKMNNHGKIISRSEIISLDNYYAKTHTVTQQTNCSIWTSKLVGNKQIIDCLINWHILGRQSAAAESRHGGLYVLLLFLILAILVRPIIWKSTGSITA